MLETGFLTTIVSQAMSLTLTDIVSIFTLAVLEGILSVDNSLVLAILVRKLPVHQQKNALTYGIVGAFIFRIIALIFAAYLIRFILFKVIGGLYLVYLAMKHMFFFSKEDAHKPGKAISSSFWKTVVLVEFTDIAFSIDSITTAVAMSDKILVIWFGGIMGIIFLRYAASFFIRALDKLPKLEDLAYQLIFFIGTKLLLEGFHIEITIATFWFMMGVIIILGSALIWRDYNQRKTRTRQEDLILEQLRNGEITIEEAFEMEYVPREVLRYLAKEKLIEIKARKQPGEATL